MDSLQKWRKAYGALKDSTKVGLANLNSDFKDLDVAIVKATNHVECPPKDRHLRKIFAATSAIRPRADVAYSIHALSQRLSKTRNWTVALKTLIVIHKTLREGDPNFREELLNFVQRRRILQLSNFKDDSSPIAWDCSAWVRAYALFLEERLECFRILKYDVVAEHLARPAEGHEGVSRTRNLNKEELLEQLPALQQLLYRLICCQPEGAAFSNYVVQYALTLVLKESFKIFCAINDAIINLVDKFFEMGRHEAVKALEIYKRAGQQAGGLSDFYEICRGLLLARNFQFPVLREPPQSFITTMEEYIREAPSMVSIPREPLDFPERLLTYKSEEKPSSPEDKKPSLFMEQPNPVPSSSTKVVEHPTSNLDIVDLLRLNAKTPNASATEESNALALAIVPTSAGATTSCESQANGLDPTGWELALVTTPSNGTSVTESQLGGGMDSLTLNSFYDEAAYEQSQPDFGVAPPNPFEIQDPFAVSNTIQAPPSVQMAAMTQQHMSMMVSSNPFLQPNDNQQSQQNMMMMMEPSNPFSDSGVMPSSVNPLPHHQ